MGVVTTSCALPPVSLASTSTGESPRDEEDEKASLLPTKDRGEGQVLSDLLCYISSLDAASRQE